MDRKRNTVTTYNHAGETNKPTRVKQHRNRIRDQSPVQVSVYRLVSQLSQPASIWVNAENGAGPPGGGGGGWTTTRA